LKDLKFDALKLKKRRLKQNKRSRE